MTSRSASRTATVAAATAESAASASFGPAVAATSITACRATPAAWATRPSASASLRRRSSMRWWSSVSWSSWRPPRGIKNDGRSGRGLGPSVEMWGRLRQTPHGLCVSSPGWNVSAVVPAPQGSRTRIQCPTSSVSPWHYNAITRQPEDLGHERRSARRASLTLTATTGSSSSARSSLQGRRRSPAPLDRPRPRRRCISGCARRLDPAHSRRPGAHRSDTGRASMVRGADRLHLTLEAVEPDDPKAPRPELVRREMDMIADPPASS